MKNLLTVVVMLGSLSLSDAAPRGPQQPPQRTIFTAIAPPAGYRRVSLDPSGFGAWLRVRPLKPAGSPVRLFDGRIKTDAGIYAAVLDLDIGRADLQQCADAVMRLRAEYLYSQGRYAQIGFHFTNGFYADYAHWRDGCRVAVKGATARWVRSAAPDGSYAQFRRYLDLVFSYAGTKSLEKELQPVAIVAMQPGDVFIRGGSPGHAVLVMDMAVNTRGEKCYLLSQSYMPAQDIQILREPGRQLDGVWYRMPLRPATIATPEWDFTTAQLRRFHQE